MRFLLILVENKTGSEWQTVMVGKYFKLFFNQNQNMNYIFTFLLLLCNLLIIKAQDCSNDRYHQRIFENIEITKDIVYGKVDHYDARGRTVLEDIKLDFYAPAGDDIQKRPLVVMSFGGGFVIGKKTDSDIQAWCDSLAHRGYVCAAIDYRKGFNTLSRRSSIRAVYRAVQDLRAAIRFLQEDPDHLGFNIDPDNIFVGGESAGAIMSLQAAFLNKEADRPIETYEKTGFLAGERSDLGCLDCSGNHYSQPVKIKGILSLWGAVNDLDIIDAEENIPTFMVHGTLDQIVPYGKGRPFNLLYFPKVYGSKYIKRRLDDLGIANTSDIYRGNVSHTVYGVPNFTFPNRKWNRIFDQAQRFLATTMGCPPPLSGAIPSTSFSLPVENNIPTSTALQHLAQNNQAIDIRLNYNKTQIIELSVFNIQGQLFYQNQSASHKEILDLNIPTHNWQRGSYFLQIRTNDGVEIRKIII